jgi:hypothetical protein
LHTPKPSASGLNTIDSGLPRLELGGAGVDDVWRLLINCKTQLGRSRAT